MLLCILILLKYCIEQRWSWTEKVTSTEEIFRHISASGIERFLHSVDMGFTDLCSVWLYCWVRNLYPCFSGSPETYWQLHHVSLNVTSKFRVVFRGVRGSGLSKGGLSIDDINLSETQCPHHVWHIRNFTHLLNTSPAGKEGIIYSPPFYSSEGYAFQVSLYVNGTTDNPFNLGIYLSLISGANDDHLKWPCPWQQVTMILLDQHPDIRQQMSNQRSVTTDPERFSG